MKNTAVITIPSHPKFLSLVRAVTAKMGSLHGIDETSVEHIKLAVDEVCSNVIKHAYRGDTEQKIIVKYRITGKHFEVIVEDNGIKAEPASIEGRSLDEVRPGGLGVHFIRRAFDVFEFDETKKKGNRTRLVLNLRGKHEH